MPKVETNHPAYDANVEKWQRCRAAFDGTDAIKGAGALFLPKLSDQSAAEYDAYVKRAMWYGATARTVEGLVGAVFRKAPTLTFPEKLKDVIDDITRTGTSLESFTKGCLSDILITGRHGVLVDMPVLPEGEVFGDIRPYVAAYDAEDIVNWRVERRAGVAVLTLVVLREGVEKEDADVFVHEPIDGGQFRVLRLDEAGYLVEIYRKKKVEGQTDEWALFETIVPTQRGKRLTFIPFQFFGASSLTASPEKPPLLDLVDVNLSHYRSSADLEHGRHFTALPTPWAAGFGVGPDNKLHIGSQTAWLTDEVNAKAGMLEFTGQGLGALETAMETKEKLMAVLGARLLEDRIKGVEAADAMRIRNSGEQSIMQSVVGTVSQGMTNVLQWVIEWAGSETDDVSIQLNRDFVDMRMSPQDAEIIVRLWQGAAITYETMYHNLQQGELTRPGVKAETERQLLEVEQPGLVGVSE